MLSTCLVTCERTQIEISIFVAKDASCHTKLEIFTLSLLAIYQNKNTKYGRTSIPYINARYGVNRI